MNTPLLVLGRHQDSEEPIYSLNQLVERMVDQEHVQLFDAMAERCTIQGIMRDESGGVPYTYLLICLDNSDTPFQLRVYAK